MIRNIVQDPSAVAEGARDHVVAAAARAIQARGEFRVVLAGGSTPVSAYRLLARSDLDWSPWRFYIGDERCVGPGDPARNGVMALQEWLLPAGIPASQLISIRAELGPEAGARDYRERIADAQPFDLVILGVGEDGHTASLFPGHEHDPAALVVAVHDAPKPPPQRVSLGYSALASARDRLVLVTGAGKAEAVERWWNQGDTPIARISASEPTTVFLDRAAAGVPAE